MHARLSYFDGPRSPELVAASDRAGRDRIEPAISNDPQLRDQLVSLLVLRRPDGGQVVITVMRSEAALARAQDVIMSTELLPGEDPALLPGPDRSETYQVAHLRSWTTAPV
jgi:hypothetical protein